MTAQRKSNHSNDDDTEGTAFLYRTYYALSPWMTEQTGGQ
jgi:hypothetical protein